MDEYINANDVALKLKEKGYSQDRINLCMSLYTDCTNPKKYNKDIRGYTKKYQTRINNKDQIFNTYQEAIDASIGIGNRIFIIKTKS
jgi:hypothetical protein